MPLLHLEVEALKEILKELETKVQKMVESRVQVSCLVILDLPH